MINIREIESRDILPLLAMGRAFTAAAAEPFDRESLTEHLEWLIESDDATAFVAVDIEGKLVGVAGVMTFPTLWDRSKILATELWWFVDPDARKLGTGGALMDAIESWAKAAGAYRLLMLTIVGVGTEVDAMYIKRGYREHERSYMKEF